MAFPTMLSLNYGNEKTVQTANIANRSLGTPMVLPDGRMFVWAKAGGTIGAGRLVQEAATSTTYDQDLVVPTARAIGSTTITLTNAVAAVVADQFKAGLMVINDEAGEGYQYKIRANAAATTTGAISFTLEPDDGIKVALTTASQVGLRKNMFEDVLISPTTETGVAIGVTPVDVVDNDYFWLQVWGEAAVLVDAVVPVVGDPVVRSFSVAGAVRRLATVNTTTVAQSVVGFARDVASSGDTAKIFLTLGRG